MRKLRARVPFLTNKARCLIVVKIGSLRSADGQQLDSLVVGGQSLLVVATSKGVVTFRFQLDNLFCNLLKEHIQHGVVDQAIFPAAGYHQ